MKKNGNGNGSKTFVTITNLQIYKELCAFKANNEIKHVQIMKELETRNNDVLIQLVNYQSRVNNLKMGLGGIGVLSMATLGWLISHLLN